MRVVTAVVCIGLITAACQTDGGAPDSRASAIRAARGVLGSAIADLGSAVVTLEGAVTRVRLGDPPTPTERRDAVAEIRAEELEGLRRALASTEDDEPSSDSPEVRAAVSAWREARRAASALLEAAVADLDHTERLTEIDDALAGIVEGWAAPGSYSQQLERFTELHERARTLSDDLAGPEARPRCSRSLQRRQRAARWTTQSTEELRGLIERRRGEEFDTRRQELTATVYGFDDVPADPMTVLARLDARERDCWQGNGATPAAADRFETAVEEVEDALNPER